MAISNMRHQNRKKNLVPTFHRTPKRCTMRKTKSHYSIGGRGFMQHPLLEQLRQGPVLCDGAMGTLLYARGITYEQCFDALNLTQPELIQGVYREYISAGAQIIETNTSELIERNLKHTIWPTKCAKLICVPRVWLAKHAKSQGYLFSSLA